MKLPSELLKEYFKNTPREQVLKDWENTAHLDYVNSPKVIKLFEGGEGEKKPINLNILKEDFIFNCDMHRQNLNGRESEKEIFIAGIESVIEEINIKFNSNQ